MKKGLFITCEGGEGAGKTTLLNKLQAELHQKGHQVLMCREPGGTALGDQIRHWLLHRDPSLSISPKAELLLFLTARAQNISENIQPALSSGKVVLCDRFNDSTVAYQGVARGIGVDYVQQLCDTVCEGLAPDLTFFLDLPVEEGLRRAAKVGALDRIEQEKIEFHDKVRQGMRQLAKQNPKRIVTLDATQSPEQVFAAAWKQLEKKYILTS